MASKYWLKLFHETIYDPKIMMRSAGARLRWYECLCLAGDYDHDGELPPIENMIFVFRISEEQLLDELTELVKAGLVTEAGGRYHVRNWNKRQGQMPDAERKYRDRDTKQKQEYYNVSEQRTKGVRNSDADIELDKDIDIDKELELEKNSTAAAEKLQTVYDIYSNNIGLLTPIITEQIKAAVKVYSVDWIDAAIQEAIHNNVRRWNYVRAILDRWQRDGFQSKAGKKPEENYKRFAGVDIFHDQIEQPEQTDLAKEFAGIIKMPVPSGPTLDDWRGYLERMTNNGITMDMMREACKDKVVFHPSQIFKECERMLL